MLKVVDTFWVKLKGFSSDSLNNDSRLQKCLNDVGVTLANRSWNFSNRS